jgi:Leucine-rich repeat (LRR) protein
VSLRDAGLAEVPCEVWQVGAAARCLDLCGNPRLCLRGVEPQLASLSNLTRLHLTACGLLDAAVAWDALCSLSQLQTLLLDNNSLTSLPESLGSLTLLKRLSVTHNALVELPASVCRLSSLQLLDVSSNKLQSLPLELGSCSALEELVLNQNCVAAIPVSLANCQGLKVLACDDNRISCAGIPPPLLRAPSLHTLSLHNNRCTIEQLREVDGYAELDARRRAKADKVVDGRVLGATKAFDEGADAARNRKF